MGKRRKAAWKSKWNISTTNSGGTRHFRSEKPESWKRWANPTKLFSHFYSEPKGYSPFMQNVYKQIAAVSLLLCLFIVSPKSTHVCIVYIHNSTFIWQETSKDHDDGSVHMDNEHLRFGEREDTVLESESPFNISHIRLLFLYSMVCSWICSDWISHTHTHTWLLSYTKIYACSLSLSRLVPDDIGSCNALSKYSLINSWQLTLRQPHIKHIAFKFVFGWCYLIFVHFTCYR